MRYFIANYYRKPSGQMDEVIQVAKRTRPKDLQSAGVILDFKNRQVVKCCLDGQVGDRDWDRVRGYFHTHYPQIINQLEKHYEEPDNPG